MPIVIRLGHILLDQKIMSQDLAARIGLSETNLSRLKQGHVKAIRFSTLEGLCRELNCKPGDILDYVPDAEDEDAPTGGSEPGSRD